MSHSLKITSVRLILGEHIGKTAERDADKSHRLWVQLLRASARYSVIIVVFITNNRRPLLINFVLLSFSQ